MPEPVETPKTVECPSCKAEIDLRPDGTPESPDVARFDSQKKLEDRVTNLESKAPVPPAVPEPQPKPTPAAPEPPPVRKWRWGTVMFTKKE